MATGYKYKYNTYMYMHMHVRCGVNVVHVGGGKATTLEDNFSFWRRNELLEAELEPIIHIVQMLYQLSH